MNTKNLTPQIATAVTHLNIQDLPIELVELSNEALFQVCGGITEIWYDAARPCTRWWAHFGTGSGDSLCGEVLHERLPTLFGD